MRKISVLLLVLCVTLGVYGQNETLPINEKTGKVTLQKVAEATGLSSSKLYDLTKAWAISKGFVTVDDVAGAKLKFDVKQTVFYPAPQGGGSDEGTVSFTFFVGFKEGKYRMILTDYVHMGKKRGSNGGKLEGAKPACGQAMSSRGWFTVKKETSKKSNALMNDLVRVIKETQNDPEQSDDW